MLNAVKKAEELLNYIEKLKTKKQNNMTSKVTNAIELVKNSPASIFTKEDVIKLLNDVSDVPAGDEADEDKDKATITEDQMNELIDAVRFDLSMSLDSADVVDLDSAKFELNGDVLSVTDIDVDTSNVENVVEDAIRSWFDNNVL
jgi:hypothetical protein